MEPNGVTVRRARATDAAPVLDLLHSSFAGYSAIAPPDWRPPEPDPDEVGRMTSWLAHPAVWYVVAEDADGHAGQCGFVQAYTERMLQGDPIAGMAHFWQLFIRPDLWGSGLAGRLHDMALDELRARGFSRARLWTPEWQDRARRFYERRGWELTEEREDRGIPAVQYVHGLR
jgi:GNAT superfamily N-acetyltransferase